MANTLLTVTLWALVISVGCMVVGDRKASSLAWTLAAATWAVAATCVVAMAAMAL